MATITSAQTGNWSNTATWVGGVVPGVNDDVFIGGTAQVITADVDISVISINRTVASSNSYVLVNTSRTITCSNRIFSNTFGVNGGLGLIYINANNPSIININSNIQGNAVFHSMSTVQMAGSATVNIVGNIQHNGGSNGSWVVNVTGTSGIINITGNINSFYNITNNADIPAALRVTGNSTITITGNVSVSGLECSIIQTTGIIFIYGNVIGSPNSSVIRNSNVIVGGNIINNASRIPFNSPTGIRLLSTVATQWTYTTENALVNKTLYDVQSLPTIPVIGDVRDGIVYADGALTGTSVMPSASTVSLGVVYDNGTVGTAQNTADLFLNALTASTSPLAVRLSNVVTTDILGAQIAAYSP